MFSRPILTILILLSPIWVMAKTTTATTSGDWTSGGTWDNGIPVSGDIININLGVTVTVSSVIDLKGAGTTILNVYGTILFDDPPGLFNTAAIRLDPAGDVANIFTGGLIDALDAIGGAITFGTAPFYLPAVLVSGIGTITTDPAGFDPNPVTGPSVISNGTLPITLLSFNADVKNNSVELKWITASEISNDFFTVERSTDAETFEKVLNRKGNGTINKQNTYVEIDDSPIIGRSYYRLKQTDFDGTTSYSDLVMVDYEGPVFATLHTYPNPSLGTSLTLQLNGVKEVMDVPVVMVSMQGEIVFKGVLHVDETGKAKREVEFQQRLASGLYVVKAGPSVFLTQKVAVIR